MPYLAVKLCFSLYAREIHILPGVLCDHLLVHMKMSLCALCYCCDKTK